MGTIIDLQRERARRRPLVAAMERLESAVARLDPLVRSRGDRLGGVIRAELASIHEAVRAGRPGEAAELAEHLADRLEHPAALGS
jgi:hypothetical protein